MLHVETFQIYKTLAILLCFQESAEKQNSWSMNVWITGDSGQEWAGRPLAAGQSPGTERRGGKDRRTEGQEGGRRRREAGENSSSGYPVHTRAPW